MERKSNIELLRLVAMLLVLFLHSNYFSLGEVEMIDIQAAPYTAFVKAFTEQLCIICVNVFVLISGWFGIRPTVKGFLALLYQVFFFHVLITVVLLCLGVPVSMKTVLKVFCFGVSYWFVASYLVLYVLSPVMNLFVKNASPSIMLSVVLTFFILEFAVGWCVNSAGFNGGYSAISFIGLYLLARFIRLYSKKLVALSASQDMILYVALSLISVLLFFVTGHDFNILSYTSPFVVGASVFFFFSFNKMQIPNNRVINYFACSAFAIYLVHLHPLTYTYYIALMKQAYAALGGYGYIVFVVVFAVVFGLFCIMLDKVRIFTWNFVYDRMLGRFVSRVEALPEKFLSIL